MHTGCYRVWKKALDHVHGIAIHGRPIRPRDFLGENNAGKWFTGFSLLEKTPDYSTICKFRNTIGCKQVSKIFAEVKRQLQGKGYAAEVFTFVDATALTSKLAMWEERDKSIQDGYEKFNNEVIQKYAKDKDVRIGSKNAKKFWIGYKKHVGVRKAV